MAPTQAAIATTAAIAEKRRLLPVSRTSSAFTCGANSSRSQDRSEGAMTISLPGFGSGLASSLGLKLRHLNPGRLDLRSVLLGQRLMVGGDRGGLDAGGSLDGLRRGCGGVGPVTSLLTSLLAGQFGHCFAHGSNTPVLVDFLVTFIACEFLTSGPAYRNFRNSSEAELGRESGTGVALCNKLSADAALR